MPTPPSLPDPVFTDNPEHPRLKIYQGDCLEILAAIHAKQGECVDMIFADPPYFLSNGGITCQSGRMVSVDKGAWDKSRGVEENHLFITNWLAACQRVLKPHGSIWVSGTAHVIHSVGFAMQQLGFKLLNDISWVKPNPPPNLSCRYFTHATETIIWAAKNKKSRHTFNYKLMREHAGGKQMKSVWTLKPPEKSEKKFGKHPTQKPLVLLERILLASTKPDELVLDPFMGSGTTLLAALRLRRSGVGIELDAAFVHVSIQRAVSGIVRVEISAAAFHFSVDPRSRSVDRSRVMPSQPHDAAPPDALRLVVRERKFFFVGESRREVIYSVVAEDLAAAWQSFHSSHFASVPIFSVIKTESEIYLLH